MTRIKRIATIYNSFEVAEETQRLQDEALTREQRLQTVYELSVLAYGPPSRLQRVLAVAEFPPR